LILNETQNERHNMSNEHTSLLQDIRESINHDCSVLVDATGCSITDIMAQLAVMDGVDADCNPWPDGKWDVYGTKDGQEFRLLVIVSNE